MKNSEDLTKEVQRLLAEIIQNAILVNTQAIHLQLY